MKACIKFNESMIAELIAAHLKVKGYKLITVRYAEIDKDAEVAPGRVAVFIEAVVDLPEDINGTKKE